MSTTSAAELDTPYALDADQLRRFREDGFIRLPEVLSASVLGDYAPEINRLVDEYNRLKDVPF
jgi:hypothetical protein